MPPCGAMTFSFCSEEQRVKQQPTRKASRKTNSVWAAEA